jgi:hypothetical protein
VSIYVFLGPTLRPSDAAKVLDVVCLPPVSQGDVYRAALARPAAIGIVDGYFNGAPSVWHKEILWALAQGIPVFGSASMGALRAAELSLFGMQGVGRIFEMFRDNILEDDDEVAVVHGPAELDFMPLSEPMVNIRATLAAAESTGILKSESRRTIEDLAKSAFFADRVWTAILDAASSKDDSNLELQALKDWLPTGRVDQKHNDAVEMLELMKKTLFVSPPRSPEVSRSIGAFAMGASDSNSSRKAIIDELRLEGVEPYQRFKTAALLRVLAGLESRRRGLSPSQGAVGVTHTGIRFSLGLLTSAQLTDWLDRNSMDAGSFDRLVEDLARTEEFGRLWAPTLDAAILDELRLAGSYERLADQAKAKQRIPVDSGIVGADWNILLARNWYFEERLGQPIPDDLEAVSRSLDFNGMQDFDGAIRLE